MIDARTRRLGASTERARGRWWRGALAGLALAAGVACSPGAERIGPVVVATTGMIAEIAERLAPDGVEVVGLMRPGIDPHLYNPTESDVRRLGAADLVLYNGFHLEGKMGSVLERIAGAGRRVVAVAETLPEDRVRREDGAVDPHVWFDVSLWTIVCGAVATELKALSPEDAEAIDERYRAVAAELLALDAWVKEEIGKIPESSRVLVTAHDAFGYFGDRYGVEVVGLQGINTAAEAGLRDIARVTEVIIDRQLKAIFVESSVPRKSIEAVQAACRDRGHEVAVGGELYSDSLGPAESGADTYATMVRHNVTTLVESLR